MTYFTDTVSSPVGLLLIEATDSGLTGLAFVDKAPESVTPNMMTDYAKKELQQYFAGLLKAFTVPLSPAGTTFQQSVWKSLSTIPFGVSVSYQYIANSINNPKAVRAVGAANGKNPIAIIVPCHRVIGKNGSLTGYAWGTEIKVWLLNHEKQQRQ
ncbi:MAG: methylated-DNA-[protein]-cysteine S-methyltransferase [Candidatus Endobugula sp.]|jgi:methylated-DNA-[protein]-cysteine S-methyltransferase